MKLSANELMVPFVKKIKEKGLKYSLVRFNLTDHNAEDFQLLAKAFPDTSNDNIEEALKEAFAYEFIEHATLGNKVIKLTAMGFSAGDQFITSSVAESSKSSLKKSSDWINEHSGLTNIYSAILATAALIVSIIALFS